MSNPKKPRHNNPIWLRFEAVLSSHNVRNTYIAGPPGVGKTFGALNLGRIDNGVYSVTLTDDTSAAELRGFYMLGKEGTEFVDGPFIKAMREGARLIINEPSHASADVLQLLFPVLESDETASLTLPTGETIVPAGGFHCVLTDNDPVEKLPEPLQDRINAVIDVDEPHPDALKSLDKDLRAVAERAGMLTDDRRISARKWINIEKLRGEFGLAGACELTFGKGRGTMVYQAIRMAYAEIKRERQEADNGNDR